MGGPQPRWQRFITPKSRAPGSDIDPVSSLRSFVLQAVFLATRLSPFWLITSWSLTQPISRQSITEVEGSRPFALWNKRAAPSVLPLGFKSKVWRHTWEYHFIKDQKDYSVRTSVQVCKNKKRSSSNIFRIPLFCNVSYTFMWLFWTSRVSVVPPPSSAVVPIRC